jgi:hypothetical protein
LLPAASSGGEFTGFDMDSTATNRDAMKLLQSEDRAILVLPCASHAQSDLIKHAAKFFAWIDSAYSACCTLSDKLISCEKLRAVLHRIQEEEHGTVRGICAHGSTRFGSRHLVMRDVQKSYAAIRRLVATAEGKASRGFPLRWSSSSAVIIACAFFTLRLSCTDLWMTAAT